MRAECGRLPREPRRPASLSRPATLGRSPNHPSASSQPAAISVVRPVTPRRVAHWLSPLVLSLARAWRARGRSSSPPRHRSGPPWLALHGAARPGRTVPPPIIDPLVFSRALAHHHALPGLAGRAGPGRAPGLIVVVNDPDSRARQISRDALPAGLSTAA